jgi:signal transduction histidine kinase
MTIPGYLTRGEDRLPRILRLVEGNSREAVVVAVVLTVVILLLDLATPLGVTIWTLYLVPFLMLALAAPRAIGGALVTYIILIAVGRVFSPPGMLDLGVVMVNWAIFTVGLLLVGALLVLIRQQHELVAAENEQRRRAEQALLTANRKLQLLSSITRHDINNQLMALDGHVELLQTTAEAPDLRLHCQAITTASERIASLIRFMAEYQTIGVDVPGWQDLSGILRAAAADVPWGEVRTLIEIPPGAEVFADPLIGRVFFNLMDNAIRYGGATITMVRFSVLDSGDARIVVCEDDGDGVRPGEKERIFDRGFGRNTGFGLFLCREILAITGIAIRETGVPGTGARFEMTMPPAAYRESPADDSAPRFAPESKPAGP